MVDSVDSILMLYSYAGFPTHSWAIFEDAKSVADQDDKSRLGPLETDMPVSGSRANCQPSYPPANGSPASYAHDKLAVDAVRIEFREPENGPADAVKPCPKSHSDLKTNVAEDRVSRDLLVKRNTMSGLSIILTLMSIFVAFRWVPFYVEQAGVDLMYRSQ